jgi:hypothetical protein
MVASRSNGGGSCGRPTGSLRSRRPLTARWDYQPYPLKVLPMSPV